MIRRLAIAMSIVCVARGAWAQGNYRSSALGGRSALMGDTGIALGTDGAAPLLNPATVVHVESTLALSVSFLTLDIMHASSWYAPNADITRVSGNAIPSTFCLFFDLPRISQPADKESHAGLEKLATCFGTSELQSFDWVGQGFQTGTPGTISTSSVRWGWQRFVVGPSYAVNVTHALALGASLHGAFTNFSSFASVGSIGTDGTASNVFQDGASGSDFGLSTTFGATLNLGHVVIGASVQSPDISIYGHGNLSNYVVTSGATNVYFGQGGFHGREPARFGLGLAYDWSRGTVEIDGQLALADGEAVQLDTTGTQLTTPGATIQTAHVVRTTRFQPTVNVGIGAELYVRPSLSILAGFATDFSAVDGLLPTSVAPAQMNRLLASFGIGSHGDAGTVIIGAQAYYSWGQMQGYASAPTVTPVGVQGTGVLFVLAGATNLKSIQRAVDDMRRIVTKPPHPH
ncbi:MAG TPA: hypothetical protein VH054_13885 [Polyangiaceae bacterium]|nr:hypothetical protein [Polyangiaceae bacterium]